MIFANVLVTLTAALFVAAQNSTAGITPCVLECSTAAAAANNCTSVADIQCVCSNAQFQADATKCLEDNCSASDVSAALNLQLAQCGAASVSPTGTAGPPRTLSISLASTASSATHTSPSSSASSPTATSGASIAGVALGAVIMGAAAFAAAL